MHAAAQDRRLLTITDYEKLPKEDAYRVDLVRGMLVRSPRPVPLHGRIAARLTWCLYGFVESAGLGVVLAEVGAVLARNPDTVRGPDIAFYAHERIPEDDYGTNFWGPPDLAVEILSPANRNAAFREKLADCFAAGVRAVWVVDPRERTVTVREAGGRARTFHETDALTGDDVLPGFRLPLATFFAL
jgi:Uma2 family endonuclease